MEQEASKCLHLYLGIRNAHLPACRHWYWSQKPAGHPPLGIPWSKRERLARGQGERPFSLSCYEHQKPSHCKHCFVKPGIKAVRRLSPRDHPSLCTKHKTFISTTQHQAPQSDELLNHKEERKTVRHPKNLISI